MDKRKFKAGLDVAADGNIPTAYGLWSFKYPFNFLSFIKTRQV
jgi:hypothetical protein